MKIKETTYTIELVESEIHAIAYALNSVCENIDKEITELNQALENANQEETIAICEKKAKLEKERDIRKTLRQSFGDLFGIYWTR